MALFSERFGFVKSRQILQLEEANEELRIGIYNMLRKLLDDLHDGAIVDSVCKELWTVQWHLVLDTFPYYPSEFYKKLHHRIMDGEWFVSYDLIEFFFEEIKKAIAFESASFGFGYEYDYEASRSAFEEEFTETVNSVLKREGSGYRFLNGLVVPITNESEIASIEQSLCDGKGVSGASDHIQRSLTLISKKPNPDYLNSVKESILAVESAAKKYAPGKNNTLADAVDSLGKSKGLHKSLVDAWKKMFGYTSDANGIRHAGSDEPVKLDFAFAKYMLVTCSAFVNYLTEEFGQDE